MQILFIFSDMVRASLLKTYNQGIKKKGPLDKFIDNFGGTIYTNCYTPAPDTPRSLACFHSGCYPSENGCNTRIKWPKFYYDKQDSVLNSLIENKFEVFYYANKGKLETGPIPQNVLNKINVIDNLKNFENTISKQLMEETDSAYFLTLDDFHWAIDDYGGNSLGDFYGQKQIDNYLNSFFKQTPKDNFDYIFWFSDHGFKLYDEVVGYSNYNLLNDSRSKVHMLFRTKGENSIKSDEKLRSIMDVYPTVLEIIKTQSSTHINGKSLTSKDGHNYVFMEDHSTFSVSINQIIDNWAVKTSNYFYFENLLSKNLFCITGLNTYKKIEKKKDLSFFSNIIKQHSSSYEEVNKQFAIQGFYNKMRIEENSYYSDKTPRTKRRKNIIRKIIIRLLFRNRYKRW